MVSGSFRSGLPRAAWRSREIEPQWRRVRGLLLPGPPRKPALDLTVERAVIPPARQHRVRSRTQRLVRRTESPGQLLGGHARPHSRDQALVPGGEPGEKVRASNDHIDTPLPELLHRIL